MLMRRENGCRKTLDKGKVCWIQSTNLFQRCADLVMEARRCAVLGKGFCSCLHRREKIVDTIKINKGLVWRGEALGKINNNSFTRMTIIPMVRKTYRLGSGFYSYLHRKILIFKEFKGPLMFEYWWLETSYNPIWISKKTE